MQSASSPAESTVTSSIAKKSATRAKPVLNQEQKQTLSQAAYVRAIATGSTPAASLDELNQKPELIELVAAALETVAGGSSPLASELRALPKGGE